MTLLTLKFNRAHDVTLTNDCENVWRWLYRRHKYNPTYNISVHKCFLWPWPVTLILTLEFNRAHRVTLTSDCTTTPITLMYTNTSFDLDILCLTLEFNRTNYIILTQVVVTMLDDDWTQGINTIPPTTLMYTNPSFDLDLEHGPWKSM